MALREARWKPTSKTAHCLVVSVEFVRDAAPDSVCDKCSGDLKNQRILGMVIIRSFHPEGDDWVGGTVVDPENGKEYKGKIWAIGNDKLGMRGFVGISLIGRTATWTRIP